MRTKINKPMPGDIIDGGRVGIPEYWRIDHVSDLEVFASDTYLRALMRLDDLWRKKYGNPRTHRAVMTRLTDVIRRFAAETGEIVYLHAGGLSDRPTGYAGRGEIRLTIWAGHYDFVLRCGPADLCVEALVGDPARVVTHAVRTVGKLIRTLEADYRLRQADKLAKRREESMRHAICREVVSILGESEFGTGYMIHDGAIETTHKFAEQHPEWKHNLGRHFRFTSGTLGVNSSIDHLERIASQN